MLWRIFLFLRSTLTQSTSADFFFSTIICPKKNKTRPKPMKCLTKTQIFEVIFRCELASISNFWPNFCNCKKTSAIQWYICFSRQCSAKEMASDWKNVNFVIFNCISRRNGCILNFSSVEKNHISNQYNTLKVQKIRSFYILIVKFCNLKFHVFENFNFWKKNKNKHSELELS